MSAIVIIDKDRLAAKALAQALTDDGHECKTYTAGKIALNDIVDDPPDLLILDVMLDDISGFHLCRILRGSRRLSAMNNDEEVRHAMAQGVDEYLAKPLDAPAVVSRVRALLAFHAETKGVDGPTKLANSDSTGREIRRRVVQGEKFALVYVELLVLRSYTESAGAQDRERIVRHLSCAITMCAAAFEDSAVFASHMGMRHFLCVLPLDNVKAYCRQVQRKWDDHLSTNAAALGLDGESENGCLDVAFYVTRRVSDQPDTTQNLLEVLMRIRGSQPPAAQAGIHLDRRAS